MAVERRKSCIPTSMKMCGKNYLFKSTYSRVIHRLHCSYFVLKIYWVSNLDTVGKTIINIPILIASVKYIRIVYNKRATGT